MLLVLICRSLEEIFKLDNTKASLFFKKLRFEIYKIEKKLLAKLKNKLDFSLLVTLNTDIIPLKDILSITKKAIFSGGKTINLEGENISLDVLLKIAKGIRKLTKETDNFFIITDRIDVAIEVEADGIYLKKKFFSVTDLKKRFFFYKPIGYAAYNEKDIQKGIKMGVDFIGIEPEFKFGRNKKLNIFDLKNLYKRYYSLLPLIVMGGLSPDKIREGIKNGIKNFAVNSLLIENENVIKIIKQFKELIS